MDIKFVLGYNKNCFQQVYYNYFARNFICVIYLYLHPFHFASIVYYIAISFVQIVCIFVSIVEVLEISALSGTASHQDLAGVKQQNRRCSVPQGMHPLTADSVSMQPTLSKFFHKLVEVDGEEQQKRMRLATSSEEDSDAENQTGAEDKDDEKKESIVPHGIESMVNTMMQQLNAIYALIRQKKTKPGEVKHAYDTDLRSSSMWKTKSVLDQFPFQRFLQHLNTEFPSGVMQVDKDRKKWSCSICPNFAGDSVTATRAFHRHNCFKHFRSRMYCDSALAITQNNKATAVAEGLQHQKESHVFAEDLAQCIVDDAIVSASRKSLSLTSIPIILDVVCRALIACRGPEILSTEEIMAIRKTSPKAATMITRINACTKSVLVCSGVRRAACRRGRSAITDRLLTLARHTLAKKVEHLRKCRYLSLTADESDTYSFSAPLAVALQGCSPEFLWANLFLGQTDVADNKSGPEMYRKLKLLLDGCHPTLLIALIFFSCFDGASAMRSTPIYAGLDSHPAGTSLHAELKRDGLPRLGNIHGLCHLLNLAQKKAYTLCGDWTIQWFDHIKGVFRWFAKSPRRKAQLKSLHKEMTLLNNVVTWRMCYPKYYCPTRWIGISRCLESILAAGPLLEEYCDNLVTAGFRPARDDDDEEEVIPSLVNATAAREEESDDDEDDDRYHADTFHVWGDQYWDLPITVPVDDLEIDNEVDRLRKDSLGRADVWKDLDAGTKRTKCVLLSERCGLTTQMLGLDAIMADALKPYKVLVERLQTQIIPIGHKIRPWISKCFKQLNQAFLDDNPSYGRRYQQWRTRDDVSEELDEQVQLMGRQYVYQFLKDAKHRLQPYWSLLLASETINPCMPSRISPSAWEGVKDLCRRVQMDADRIVNTIKELKLQHQSAEEWCRAEVRNCQSNLLKFYHDRLTIDTAEGVQPEYPLANEFATMIFSLHYVSSSVETYFSKTRSV